jgi:hypothetical protein
MKQNSVALLGSPLRAEGVRQTPTASLPDATGANKRTDNPNWQQPPAPFAAWTCSSAYSSTTTQVLVDDAWQLSAAAQLGWPWMSCIVCGHNGALKP